MSHLRRGPDRMALCVMLFGAVLAACAREQAHGGVRIGDRLSDAQCPYHDSVRVRADQATAVYDTLPLVGAITNIPEFHDCQRFIDSAGANYGPLVGIFAVETLDAFDPTPAVPLRTLDFRVGVLSFDSAGPLKFDPDFTAITATRRPTVAPTTPVPAAKLHPAGYPIGIIVDLDQVPYDRLGIKPGVNCLYVYPDGTGPHGLGATVVPVGSLAQDCARPYSRDMVGTDLEVHRRRMPLDHADDYPPVARWDWDAGSSTQYIGIRCGRAWCEIGPKQEFSPSETHLYFLTDHKERRVFAVKGWHDEQWLARAGFNGLYPQPFRGTVVPVKNLGDITSADFTNHWIDVAGVTIAPHDPMYETKFHFTTSAMPKHMNRLALCLGTWDDCMASEPPAARPRAAPTCPTGADGRWWARITNTKKETYYRCVLRHANAGIAMPGTARWRWTDEDEWIWIECDEGCCQVQSGDR